MHAPFDLGPLSNEERMRWAVVEDETRGREEISHATVVMQGMGVCI